MREILFRGKTDKGEWVQGDLLHADLYGNGCAIEDFTKEKNNCFDVDPSTVGQYTGLTDKNDTKIFEGDIVKHYRTLWGADISDIGVILWCEHTCRFYRTSNFDTISKVEIWEDTSQEYEVIGNIHDKPELLKESEGK